MLKQKKQFFLFLIVLLVCVVAYAGIRLYTKNEDEKKDKEEEASKTTVAEIDEKDIESFSYTYNGAELSFSKKDDAWCYDADESIAVNQDAVSTMLSNLKSLKAEDKIEDYESTSDYGFDDPSMILTVTMKDGTDTFTFGMENSMLSQDYMMKDSDDTVYLMAAGIKSAFYKSIDDLTAKEDTETEVSESAISENTESAQ